MAYTKYSLTPANNNAAPPDGAPEGMLPSAVNDTMRDMMAQIRDVGDGIRDGTYTMTAPKITGGTITGVTFSSSAATITGGSVTGVTFSSSAATITGGSITGITDLAVADGGTGSSTASGARANLLAVGYTATTGSAIIPSGTTAERDGSPAAGYFRYNSTLTKAEIYNGTSWGSVGGGATGGGSDQVFYENDQTVTTNYTITTNKNAMSAGAITIATGVTVTVPTGSTWIIV